jgi:uncharacterized protein (TIGR00369 family)
MTKLNHLDDWLAEEATTLQRLSVGQGPGVARPEQIVGRSGLEQMQAMLRGELPFAAITHALDFMVIDIGDGTATLQGTPGPQHFNPMGSVHGGWFATLLDSALGCAVHTKMLPGRGYTTAELSVNIVRALTPKVPPVRAIGRMIHCGRQLATADAQLIGPDGTLHTYATITGLVFDLQHEPAGGATT